MEIRYSDDGGHNYSDWRDLADNETGDFLNPLIARRLGMTRSRIWELRDASATCADILAVSLMADSE